MRSTRRAKLSLNADHLREIVNLPAGVHVVAVEVGNDPVRVSLLVEGPTLPETPIDSEAPIMWLHAEQHACPGAGAHVERKFVLPDGSA